MWRDSGHLTTTFVKRLTPSWRALLSGAMAEIDEGEPELP